MATTEKTCFKCKAVKPITEFYVHPAMGDGRLNKCKECAKADVHANYQANKDYYREWRRLYVARPERAEKIRQYLSTESGKESARKSRENYWARYPEKRSAHIWTRNAIRDGRLIQKPCEKCGEPKSEAHHDDYSKPAEVRWLCKIHHMEHHRMERAVRRNASRELPTTPPAPAAGGRG